MLHVAIQKNMAQEYIKKLRDLELIDTSFKIQHDENNVYIPVRENMPGYHIIDMKPVEAVKNGPERVSFSYDIIGNIAIIKGKSYSDAEELSKFLVNGKNIKSVYLDAGVSGELRTRKLTLLYGIPATRTLYHENGINLIVDVSEAYFSPRLATERLRISNEARENEKILDMFCGIGPFSILIAKKVSCNILAIDKNEKAIELFRENILLNKLKGKITIMHGDSGQLETEPKIFDRIIMNLPHNSFDYLGQALEKLKSGGIINYYEICNLELLETRMEQFRDRGLEIVYKRIVHGFSKYESMYSIEMKKI
ncbi:MAG: class I SAM-dependent methyltransferase family protein [Ferroplasma sp.]